MSEVHWQIECKDNKSRMEHILKNEKFTDCQFLVGQESDKAVTIRGHKVILATASPVFERMFYGSFDNDKSNEMRILDINHNIFYMMMEYIYFEKLELTTLEDTFELYFAAKKYMLQNLMGACTDCIPGSSKNLWKLYEFAVLVEKNSFITACVKAMARNALNVLKDPGLVDANLTTLIALFERDELNIDSELDLFQALDQYALANGYFDAKNSVLKEEVESEIEERRLLREALRIIRFLCLKPEQFEIVAKSRLLTDSEILSILLNINIPNIKGRPMPEGFSNSRTQRKRAI